MNATVLEEVTCSQFGMQLCSEEVLSEVCAFDVLTVLNNTTPRNLQQRMLRAGYSKEEMALFG